MYVLGKVAKKYANLLIHFMVPDRGASMGEKKLNYNTLTQVYFFEKSAAFGHLCNRCFLRIFVLAFHPGCAGGGGGASVLGLYYPVGITLLIYCTQYSEFAILY
jgi:hypothetical protein